MDLQGISDNKSLSWYARCVSAFRAQGLTLQEISEVMGKSIATIKRAHLELKYQYDTSRLKMIPGSRVSKRAPRAQNDTPKSGTEVAPSDSDSSLLFPEISNPDTQGDRGESEGGKREPYSEAFGVFWKDYPRKVGKDDAFTKWKACLKAGATHDSLLRAARNYAIANSRTEPKRMKHCSTFLGPGNWWKEWVNGDPDDTPATVPPPPPTPEDEAEEQRVHRAEQILRGMV